jgi:hypothetical protein
MVNTVYSNTIVENIEERKKERATKKEEEEEGV